MFPSLAVEYLNPGISYHSPLVLRCDNNETRQMRPFVFFNYMAAHNDFLVVVENH